MAPRSWELGAGEKRYWLPNTVINIMHIQSKGYSPIPKNIYLINIQGTKLIIKEKLMQKVTKVKVKRDKN